MRLGTTLDIELTAIADHYGFFLPLGNAEIYRASNDNEADRNAAYKMAQLYDLLVHENKENYNSLEHVHNLNVFLSRLLFCFFAEDTGIFDEESIFTNTLVQNTLPNGSDTHYFLNTLFDRLNNENGIGYPAHLAAFPYVNGGLFKDKIDSPIFTSKARNILIELGELDWQNINPDIFGSMIQAVVNAEYRSDLGMHYTSVPNILKVIKPLFLNELREEFEKSTTIPQLRRLIRRMANMQFFDPACGSGNFLIITYKEIRRLEVEVLKRIIELEDDNALFVYNSNIKLSQFYGIEIDDFAHEVAILSMWLAEHQMNQYFEDQLEGYTEYQSIIPLKKSGHIVQGNAARMSWQSVCPVDDEQETYVIGNPPFLGSRNQDKEQKEDMKHVFRTKYKSLDYVSIWFYKGAKYIEGKNAQLAFVSTNSVTQGLLVSITWPRILNENIEIGFAYQSFKWTNNAKRNAGVTVVILNLRNISNKANFLYSNNIKKEAKNINSYLLDSPNIYVVGAVRPISNFPIMNYGNMPLEGGHLRFNGNEKEKILSEKGIEKFIKRVIGGSEFLRGQERYCFWIEDDELEEALNFNQIRERVNLVREFRENGGEVARTLASRSHQFRYRHVPMESQIIVPCTSSEARDYIPIGIYDKTFISLNSVQTVYDAQPWLFGIIHSRMHMVWVRAVGGKLKTDYRYSARLCYNTFPFPDISTKQKERLNQYVYDILDEREKHPEKTMAQLYDPDKMPAGLRLAHQALDKAVEQCYRLQPFKADSDRLEYLFRLYEEMTKTN